MVVLRILTLIAMATAPLAASADPEPAAAANSAAGKYPELTDIIDSFSKRTGTRFNVDPRVRAIPILVGIDPKKITYEQLLATFVVHQFASYVQDGVVIVVPDANARQMPTPVYSDAGFKADANEWVTLLLAPKKACAAQLVPILRPLMPQAAHLAADMQGGSLLVVDRAANVRRIAELVDRIDKAAPDGRGCREPAKGGQ